MYSIVMNCLLGSGRLEERTHIGKNNNINLGKSGYDYMNWLESLSFGSLSEVTNLRDYSGITE
jgi:hypothetical protein